MGLSAYEQQELDSIEKAIASSDLRLDSMLSTFARLTAGDELPVREQIRTPARRTARRLRGHRGRQLAWPLLWLSVSIALIAVALVLSRGENAGACTVRVIACAGHAPAHSAQPAARTGSVGWG